ncbi:hypothetical protein ACHAWF_002091 [Thalassiosira exigua]
MMTKAPLALLGRLCLLVPATLGADVPSFHCVAGGDKHRIRHEEGTDLPLDLALAACGALASATKAGTGEKDEVGRGGRPGAWLKMARSRVKQWRVGAGSFVIWEAEADDFRRGLALREVVEGAGAGDDRLLQIDAGTWIGRVRSLAGGADLKGEENFKPTGEFAIQSLKVKEGDGRLLQIDPGDVFVVHPLTPKNEGFVTEDIWEEEAGDFLYSTARIWGEESGDFLVGMNEKSQYRLIWEEESGDFLLQQSK